MLCHWYKGSFHCRITRHKTTDFYVHIWFQAVFSVDKEDGLTLIEIADGVDVQDILTSTSCEFEVSPDLKIMAQVPVEEES